jgi:alkylhydroperoxidase family enzyme
LQPKEAALSLVTLVEYADAPPEVRAAYDDITKTRGTDWINNSHTAAARKKGMSEAMFTELMAVVGLANETNRRSDGFRLDVHPQFK